MPLLQSNVNFLYRYMMMYIYGRLLLSQRHDYQSHLLMKLLLVIEIHVTTAALSLSRPDRGQKSNKPSTLPLISHVLGVALELPWSIYCVVWGRCA